uniref:sulfite oxidase n=1 Tax=Entomoneis paludosa TaxID=265537 RepID=A0A7S2YTY0_9STRA|mmetsp:Transcript_9720/g.20134  ORF Transcript_9720/g.20134 Transcript_9720/m.20134 type:complete len:673 (+) Transcript_9720:14-2032(+)
MLTRQAAMRLRALRQLPSVALRCGTASSSDRLFSTSAAAVTAVQQQQQHPKKNLHPNSWFMMMGAGLLGLSAGTVAMMEEAAPSVETSQDDPQSEIQATSAAIQDEDHVKVGELDNHPPPRPELPTIPLDEVAEHCDEDSMWFTFRGAVYDLTFFINGHPGGTTRLLMAAGQDLEPYWEIYRQHFRGHVVDWMEKYRIGNLSPEDTKRSKDSVSFGDMYDTDPERHPDLLSCTQRPFNGEPRIELLTNDYITPNELFYVRNHLAVPEIDPEEYVLIVKGKGIKKHKFTLEDLKTKFPKHEVVTTLQCAGNRREDLHVDDHKVFIAPHWVVGAISCAKWGGPKMRDVLEYCGLDVDGMALGKVKNDKIKHVQFEGYDMDETGLCYGGSIPVEKAVDGLGDAIFAYEMNGETLPRDHGYPVRAIAPGHAGARQCKWLHKVIVSDKESQKSWQQKSYRTFAPDVDFENDLSHWPPPRLDQAMIVQTMPIQSLVCNPPQNSTIGGQGATSVTVKGVAWSGGGKQVVRVDVSIDGGKTWTASELYKPIEQGYNRHWAWTQFSKTLELPEEIQEKLRNGEKVELDIVSKAMNSDCNVQPERMEPYWNARGVGINHWYHVNTTLDPKMDKGASPIKNKTKEEEFGNTPTGGKFQQHWDMHGWTADPEHKDNARSAPTKA